MLLSRNPSQRKEAASQVALCSVVPGVAAWGRPVPYREDEPKFYREPARFTGYDVLVFNAAVRRIDDDLYRSAAPTANLWVAN